MITVLTPRASSRSAARPADASSSTLMPVSSSASVSLGVRIETSRSSSSGKGRAGAGLRITRTPALAAISAAACTVGKRRLELHHQHGWPRRSACLRLLHVGRREPAVGAARPRRCCSRRPWPRRSAPRRRGRLVADDVLDVDAVLDEAGHGLVAEHVAADAGDEGHVVRRPAPRRPPGWPPCRRRRSRTRRPGWSRRAAGCGPA